MRSCKILTPCLCRTLNGYIKPTRENGFDIYRKNIKFAQFYKAITNISS